MKNNFNTICIFKAYGVENLDEIQDFDEFFGFLKEKYTNKEIVEFIYEIVDNNDDEPDENFLKFYTSIPEDIDRELNEDMGLTESIQNIREGNFLPVLEEIEKNTIELVKRGKSLISKQEITLSLFEKGLEMLNPYDEKDYQRLKTEMKKNFGKEQYKNAEVLFQKDTLKEQKKYFKTEIKRLKSENVEWRSEIIKVFKTIMTVECIDELIKVEDDNEFVDLLLEQRQKIKNNPIKLNNGKN